jgi:CBS domain-containing protein
MNPSTFLGAARRAVPLLRHDQVVGSAVDEVLGAGVPALPVVDERERFVGVFGEREFIHAVFPAYLDTLGHAGFVPKSLDAMLERGAPAAEDPISKHMTTDHVEVGDDASDSQIAETFLHHRVLIIPIVEHGRVTGIVTRADFFRALAERFREFSA